jgi:transcriptional regulator with XRE-family HTH domain
MSKTEKCPPYLRDVAMGAAIRMKRRVAGLSERELAEACDLTVKQVAALERGRSHLPASSLPAFARALGCDEQDLIAVHEEFTGPPKPLRRSPV